MRNILARLNFITLTRVAHGVVAALLVAGLISLGTKLYSEFYLPYNLEDAPIAPSTKVQDSPEAKAILQTARLLEKRRATTTEPSAPPSVFWPATSTAPTAKKR